MVEPFCVPISMRDCVGVSAFLLVLDVVRFCLFITYLRTYTCFYFSHSNKSVWNLIIILVGMSLIPCDVEDLFTYFFSISLSSLVKCLLSSFAHFTTGLFIFSLEFCTCSLYSGHKSIVGYVICKHCLSRVYVLSGFFLFLFLV